MFLEGRLTLVVPEARPVAPRPPPGGRSFPTEAGGDWRLDLASCCLLKLPLRPLRGKQSQLPIHFLSPFFQQKLRALLASGKCFSICQVKVMLISVEP